MRTDTLYLCATILLAALVLAVAGRSRPVTVQIPSECSLTVKHHLVLPMREKDANKTETDEKGGETP